MSADLTVALPPFEPCNDTSEYPAVATTLDVHVLHGPQRINVGNQAYELWLGETLQLSPGAMHDLKADEQGGLRLTLLPTTG